MALSNEFRSALAEHRALSAGDRREAMPRAGGIGDVFTLLPVAGRPTPPRSVDGTPPAPIPGGFVVRPQGHPDGSPRPGCRDGCDGIRGGGGGTPVSCPAGWTVPNRRIYRMDLGDSRASLPTWRLRPGGHGERKTALTARPSGI